jgi:hypothetical protein
MVRAPILLAALPAALLLTSACASTPPDTPASPAPVESTCAAFFRRERACTDTFVPGLVDLHIAHDHPAGTAAEAQRIGRDAMIARAMEEWKSDSTDASIERTCATMVGSKGPDLAAKSEEARSKCLAISACAAFSACALSVTEQRLLF